MEKEKDEKEKEAARWKITLAQDTEELEKEIREELPVNTSKSHPKHDKVFSSKTVSTSDPPEVLVKTVTPSRRFHLWFLLSHLLAYQKMILTRTLPKCQTDKSKSNMKQSSVPPAQTKSGTKEYPKQIKKKKKARWEN